MPNDDREIPKLSDTSKLADTPEYWATLADRVTAHATHTSTSVEWLARSRAGWIGALAVLAASIVILASMSARQKRDSADDAWTRALVPETNTARVVLTAEGPPRIESLLFLSRSEAR